MRAARAIVKYRIVILIIGLVLLAASVLGMINTRVNYDMLTYLSEDMETVIGQDILLDEFGKGAFSFVIAEDLSVKEAADLKAKIGEVPHVDSVIWYDSILDPQVPMDL